MYLELVVAGNIVVSINNKPAILLFVIDNESSRAGVLCGRCYYCDGNVYVVDDDLYMFLFKNKKFEFIPKQKPKKYHLKNMYNISSSIEKIVFYDLDELKSYIDNIVLNKILEKL